MLAFVEGLVIDRVGEEAEEPGEEEDHRHEEQEQPERDRTADERARRVAVAVPHADADVDERPVLVLVVGLLCLDPALRCTAACPTRVRSAKRDRDLVGRLGLVRLQLGVLGLRTPAAQPPSWHLWWTAADGA